MDEDKEMMKKRIKYFFDNFKKVHIKVSSGRFYNGTIHKIEDAGIILNDIKLGEYPIFYQEINSIAEQRKEGEISQ